MWEKIGASQKLGSAGARKKNLFLTPKKLDLRKSFLYFIRPERSRLISDIGVSPIRDFELLIVVEIVRNILTVIYKIMFYDV